MLGRLFLLFTVVPVVELWLLITIGQHLGAAATVAIVLTTGMLGAWLARREGSRVLRAWQEAGQRGEMPKDGFVSSALVLVGGVLLITPGVVTDFVGLVLLVPLTRRAIAKYVRGWLQARFEVQTFTPGAGMFVDLGGGQRPEPGDIIDAEVIERPASRDQA
jgi:UPF0716 protein FxsA